ncbi:MAG: acetyl-CoA carboxylase carboxyltransferase subunit alpha [Candidatus Humimicrobiaceae bacterium]
MDLNKIKNIPKHYFKEILKSFSRLEKLKKLNLFSGIHFKEAEKKLAEKVENYKKVEKEAMKAWKIVQLSRHDKRPQTSDYIEGIFDEFIELSGDRLSADDQSITAGLGKINGRTVAAVGHTKGKNIKERIKYNFGMSSPQGFRKSQRIMELADRFGFPVITFIDTGGAYPGIEAEDGGQAGAISNSILRMFKLKVPVISVLIGEGGSGGALALAIGNYIIMLKNSTYSVISPEGCAAILWKDPSGTKLAARALKLTSKELHRLGIIDRIVNEPMGGAHTRPDRMVKIIKKNIEVALRRLENVPGDKLKADRAEKFEKIGYFGS